MQVWGGPTLLARVITAHYPPRRYFDWVVVHGILHRFYILQSVPYQKKDWQGPAQVILLLVWQRQRFLGVCLRDTARARSVGVYFMVGMTGCWQRNNLSTLHQLPLLSVCIEHVKPDAKPAINSANWVYLIQVEYVKDSPVHHSIN